jgi:hypothetical protein
MYLESERLLALPLAQVLRQRPEASFILARITAPDAGNPALRGMSDEQVIARLRQASPKLFGDLMLPPGPAPDLVTPLLSVDARFAQTQLVEHVRLYRVSGTRPMSDSPVE